MYCSHINSVLAVLTTAVIVEVCDADQLHYHLVSRRSEDMFRSAASATIGHIIRGSFCGLLIYLLCKIVHKVHKMK